MLVSPLLGITNAQTGVLASFLLSFTLLWVAVTLKTIVLSKKRMDFKYPSFPTAAFWIFAAAYYATCFFFKKRWLHMM